MLPTKLVYICTKMIRLTALWNIYIVRYDEEMLRQR